MSKLNHKIFKDMKHAAKSSSAEAAAGVTTDPKERNIIQKFMDDKKAINQFFRGEISINEIDSRGIRFIKPV